MGRTCPTARPGPGTWARPTWRTCPMARPGSRAWIRLMGRTCPTAQSGPGAWTRPMLRTCPIAQPGLGAWIRPSARSCPMRRTRPVTWAGPMRLMRRTCPAIALDRVTRRSGRTRSACVATALSAWIALDARLSGPSPAVRVAAATPGLLGRTAGTPTASRPDRSVLATGPLLRLDGRPASSARLAVSGVPRVVLGRPAGRADSLGRVGAGVPPNSSVRVAGGTAAPGPRAQSAVMPDLPAARVPVRPRPATTAAPPPFAVANPRRPHRPQWSVNRA